MEISLHLDQLQNGGKFARSLAEPNNSREKLRLTGDFSVYIGKKSSYSRIKCSSLQLGLVKPRPIPKPSIPKPTKKEDVKEEVVGTEIRSVKTRNRKDLISSICAEIEKLVWFKRYREALEFFQILENEDGHGVGASTCDALINACIQLRSIRGVTRVRKYIVSSGIEPDQYLMNRMLLMHVKCGMMIDAWKVFDSMPMRNYVSLNTMITGLVDSGAYVDAFKFILMMSDYSDAGPRFLVPMIRAAAGLEQIFPGKILHGLAVKLGLSDDVFVSCTLIDMYSKCGSIEDARFVFDEMPEKNIVGWNSIIAGYTLHGCSEEALSLYYEMQEAGVKMNHFTLSIILGVCSRLGSLEHAKQAHAGLVRNGFALDIIANSSLVDFYSKWGKLEDARNVFDRMPRKNVISWNAMIAGYGRHGRGAEAVELFNKMVHEGMVPNHVTFLAVLSACSYSSLIDDGWGIFHSMCRHYKVKPRPMHYACMIELLGQEGHLDEAYSLIRDAPFKPTLNMWAALLTACRVNKNSFLGKLAAEELYDMKPKKLSNYLVLLNIYNKSGKLEKAASVLQTLKRKGLRMSLVCTWIEIKKKQEVFYSGDKHHAQTKEIYENLDNMMIEISKNGYVAKKTTLLPDVDEREQELHLYHSEKLAISFGVINTPNFTQLQLIQSHRICNDCHHAIKFIAMVTQREIVIRDGSRFHRFKNGSCSCGDYW